jgi:hypothetical protein
MSDEHDETTELLIRARGLLARGWCRDRSALDADGDAVHPRSPRAVAWCIYGALIASGMTDYRHWPELPAAVRLKAVIGGSLVVFNEAQETVEPVLAAFDRAIAAGPTQ